MYSEISSNKRRSAVLLVVFILVVVGLGWVIDAVWFDTGGIFAIIAFLFSLVSALISYYAGDKIALSTSGAKRIEKKDAPELYRLVENLCITNGQPLPKVHIIQDPAPNAFACGRDPEHASVAFTTGLLERLDRTELEGVVAHELSHIKNFDIRVMTLTVVLVGTVALLADIALRSMWFGGGQRNRREGGGLMLVLGLVAIIVAPIAANLIKLAVSRQREYLADASGSLLTRYPDGLARALEKISAYEPPMRHAHTSTAHLFIANPFGRKDVKIGKLFSTHPPAQERIARLRNMIGHA